VAEDLGQEDVVSGLEEVAADSVVGAVEVSILFN
jgi:hypothetical protein